MLVRIMVSIHGDREKESRRPHVQIGIHFAVAEAGMLDFRCVARLDLRTSINRGSTMRTVPDDGQIGVASSFAVREEIRSP